ncbi:MAG: hypothetical protein IT219_05770, partial [Bacteroidales bacterium]|nr:hypothetical protein [Bacteroidales bacterium]
MKRCFILLTIILLFAAQNSFSQEFNYQLPPQAIIDMVDSPSTPNVSIGTKVGKILLLQGSELPVIADLASPELKLAGVRIDPNTNGPSRSSYSQSLALMDIDGKNEIPVKGLPAAPRLRNISWSPDEKHIAFTQTTENTIELWVVEVATATARKLTKAYVNEALWGSFVWMPDNYSILFKAVPDDRGLAPTGNNIPKGPVVQENIGRKAAVRTFQDLLKNP